MTWRPKLKRYADLEDRRQAIPWVRLTLCKGWDVKCDIAIT
jgi:hypothetical protein